MARRGDGSSTKPTTPLLAFLCDALLRSGCRLLKVEGGEGGAFRLAFEGPLLQRSGLAGRLFRLRPDRADGDGARMILRPPTSADDARDGLDPFRVFTAVHLGVDPARGLFVAFDPARHFPEDGRSGLGHNSSSAVRGHPALELLPETARSHPEPPTHEPPERLRAGQADGAGADVNRVAPSQEDRDESRTTLLANPGRVRAPLVEPPEKDTNGDVPAQRHRLGAFGYEEDLGVVAEPRNEAVERTGRHEGVGLDSGIQARDLVTVDALAPPPACRQPYTPHAQPKSDRF